MSNHSATILEQLKPDHSDGSARDVTVTLPHRSRPPTVRSSARSARSGRSARSARSPSGSEGEHGVPLSPADSQEYSEGDYSDEDDDEWERRKRGLGRSESASSASNHQHHAVAPDRRRPYRGAHPVRLVRSLGVPRGAPQPPSPESLASAEEYGMDSRMHGYYARPQAYAYARSNYTSGGYPQQYVSPTGQQLVPFNANAGYPYPGYGPGGAPQYYNQPPMTHHTPSPYDMMPQGNPGYFPYPQAYPPPQSAVFQYQQAYPAARPPPAPASEAGGQTSAGLEELKELFVKEKQEREAREKKEKEALAQAQLDKKHAEEIKAAAEKAAAEATTEAEKKAAAKAEEEAKKAAEDAALAAALAILPPEEKKRPIKFKDAVGRKFSFPFHLCQTWEGMEDLIRQAFLHIDVIGPQVDKGHYDLIGPNNEIILPGVWETVIEPDWTITMHMWPMPEEEKTEEAPEAPAAKGKGKGKGKAEKKGKAKPAAKSKKEAPAASSSKNDEMPPPPPPAPVAPPGVVAVEIIDKPKKKKPSGFGLFGGGKAKAKPAAKDKKK